MHCAIACDSAAAAAVLSATERAALERLPLARRADWRAGRLAAKRSVAGVSGLALDRIEIESRADGAPRAFLADDHARHPLGVRLSLAHESGRAVAVASRDAFVGVDVERERSLPRKWAAFFLTANEQRHGADALLCWVLKEAAWKAMGLTRADPLASLELVWRDAEMVGICHSGVYRAARAVLCRPWQGFLAAAVILPEAV
jgi:phosphopantetheinyl transferase